jgi:uncharacterized membrane protein YfcA
MGLLLFGAAAAGGAINSVAGGGSFIAFPSLLFAGVAPVAANATNTVALWPGSVASAVAYRAELTAVRRELVPLGIAALLGGLAGAILLLRTSETRFVALIPWLLLFATLVFSFGTRVGKWIMRGRAAEGEGAPRSRASLPTAFVVQLLISVYGGYFGGGMGIMMLAVLSVLGMRNIHEMNGIKNVLATLINGVAVASFIVARAVDWAPGVVMIAGGIAGGYFGARIARKVKPAIVRAIVLGVAWGMTGYFFLRTYA